MVVTRWRHIFILNFHLFPFLKLDRVHANKIKHDYSSELRSVVDPRYDNTRPMHVYYRSIDLGLESYIKRDFY